MLSPYSNRLKHMNFKKAIALLPGFTMILFIFVSLLTTDKMNGYLTYDNVNKALNSLKAEMIVDLMGNENPYFKQVLPDGYQSVNLAKLSFQAITNINVGDTRTLLGNELPGFSIYDTDIYVAGVGTNYTNIPIESPPPLDYIMKDKQGNSKNDSKDNSSQKVPPQKNKNGQVFIYSTHSWESFLPILGLSGDPDSDKATSDSKNIHIVDEMLAKALDKKNIPTVADTTSVTKILNDKGMGTGQAYDASRTIVKPAVTSGKNYQLFIDIHRDDRRKKDTTVTINNKSYARTVFVIGKENPNFEKNRDVADKLNKKLDNLYPGLSRGIIGKSGKGVNGVYNQDLSPHAILIEVGGVDNTKEDLQNTVNALSDVISDYIKGNHHT
ncbi:stage II sporulation protein P [Scopulibacillus cellulosilyticus]|uniref:Stage II sporulation protein P n=1 Tax=Scopulibacillus cellulosilyticus TaxID=2665665 RepID=A0ABW2PUM4_9BACL